MKNAIILFLTLITIQAFSQVPEKVNENNYYSLNSQYLFNQFIDGEVHFKNGLITEGELNYNVLVGEFHYIEDGILKTFSDYDLNRISKISIGQKQFIIKSNIIYQILYADIMILLRSKTAVQKDLNQNEGAYGTSSNTVTNKKITTLSHAIGHEMEKGAIVNFKDELNDLEIKIDETLKLLYNNKIYSANKKTFYETFPSHKEAIKDYIQTEKIKFKSPDSIIKLIAFCKEL